MLSLMLRRPMSLMLGLGVSFATTARICRPTQLICEAPRSGSLTSHERDPKVPIARGGRLNPAAFKQISTGSALGLVTGIAISTFSKTLTFLFGLAIFGVQYLHSKGIDIIPTARLQRYVKGMNLQSLIEDNVAFKMSFAATFMLSTFAEL